MAQGKRDDATHWTNDTLEAAAEDYCMACKEADAAVRQILKDLCQEMQVSRRPLPTPPMPRPAAANFYHLTCCQPVAGLLPSVAVLAATCSQKGATICSSPAGDTLMLVQTELPALHLTSAVAIALRALQSHTTAARRKGWVLAALPAGAALQHAAGTSAAPAAGGQLPPAGTSPWRFEPKASRPVLQLLATRIPASGPAAVRLHRLGAVLSQGSLCS